MEYSDISLCWALMPLSEGELSKIPESHRRRPYLLLKKDDGFYWAFPATSKVFGKNVRYTNSTMIIRSFSYEKSLVLLNDIYKLPMENLCGCPIKIYKNEENELIKKLQASLKFSAFPSDVVEFINSKKCIYERNDMISHNNELYVIVGKVPGKDVFYSFKVYNHEVDGTILKYADTNKYYVDSSQIHCIVPNESTEYISIIHGLSFGTFEKDSVALKEMMQSLQLVEKVSSNLSLEDFKYFGKLPIGTVISYVQDEMNYKMIILDRDDKNTTVIFGLENQIYRDFEVGVYPNDYNFEFSIVNTLDDNRVERLISTKLNNIENYLLVKRS